MFVDRKTFMILRAKECDKQRHTLKLSMSSSKQTHTHTDTYYNGVVEIKT